MPAQMKHSTKTFLILGDSWGVPNTLPVGDPPETHIEHLLAGIGHRVINCAKNAGSNQDSIRRARKIDEKVDYCIWFHTELLRDRYSTKIDINQHRYTIQQLIDAIADKTYAEYDDLIAKLDCRSIVIGGQAPVLGNPRSDYMIRDWRSYLLMEDMPVQTLCHIDLIESTNCVDTLENKNRMLEKNERVLEAMQNSNLFPDNCHPGKKAHRGLFGKIKRIIC